MKSWSIRQADPEAVTLIAERFFLPQALAHVLVSRGLDTVDKVTAFLDLSFSGLISPFDLSNMQEACTSIIKAIQCKAKIIIHGDFDADGITSSALFSLFFDKIAYPVDVYIPNRLQENHGISEVAIDRAIDEGYGLLITCDCGSSSHDSIAKLLDQGVRVIVTDHHHVGDPLPEGALLINPQQTSNQADMEELAGVGVVFLTMMALRKQLRDQGYFKNLPEPNLKCFLDVVALGTIADLAPMKGLNRLLVAHGLEVMKSQPQIGIAALKQVGGLEDDLPINGEDVGFKIAPKINAAARLGHADEAVSLLVCQDPAKGKLAAQRLLAYNDERKSKQEKMFAKALPEAQRQAEMQRQVLVVAGKDFHPGIIGLLAQKLSQNFDRPAFAFAIEEHLARGSARSPEGYHLMDLLTPHADMFAAFGGHAQAGGCSLPIEGLQEFTRKMQEQFEQLYKDQPRVSKWVDARLELREINAMFFEKLEKLRPFGMGYKLPVFETQGTVVGKPFEVGHDHLKFKVSDESGHTLQGIAFGKYKAWKDRLTGDRVLMVQPQQQYFRGAMQISLQLLDFA